MKTLQWLVWLVALFLGSIMASGAWAQCSPILIDLGKNGIDLGPAGVGVYFDVNDDGALDHVQWVKPGGDEAFLALDRDGNGVVDTGAELFGVGTPLTLEGTSAPNGFVGLAQYDSPRLGGNDDGLITNADGIWNSLRLWRDSNADGASTLEEMLTLESAAITSLQTVPKSRKYYDAAGNIIPYWAWATTDARRQKTLMVDVYFLVLPDQRQGVCIKPSRSFHDRARARAGRA